MFLAEFRKISTSITIQTEFFESNLLSLVDIQGFIKAVK